MKGRLPTRTADRYAVMCANTLRRFLPRVRSQARIGGPANRDDTIAALEQALGRRGRRVSFGRQVGRRGTYLGAAAVLLVAGWIKVVHRPSSSDRLTVSARADRALTMLDRSVGPASEGGVVVAGGAERRPLIHGMTLEPGTRLMAPATTEVRIGTADGTVLTLEKAGELTVVEQSALQRFSLKQGAVRAQVAKLQPKERFVIATDDAEVEVHGTVFRVAVVPSDPTCGAGVRTRISVFEGVVSVRAGGVEAFVPPGERWPTGCVESESETGPKAAEAPPSTGTSPAIDGLRPAVSAVVRRPQSVAARPLTSMAGAINTATAGSALGTQNDLFLTAIRAKRQGRVDDAVRLLSSLVDMYPAGPLAESAMAERMRLLRSVDRGAAGRAANQYLSRFPSGFARAEAERVVGSEP